MDNGKILNNLLYRRQFILADQPAEDLTGWKTVI